MTALDIARDSLRYAKSDLNTALYAQKIYDFCDNLIKNIDHIKEL